jgi:hypothetical protein
MKEYTPMFLQSLVVFSTDNSCSFLISGWPTNVAFAGENAYDEAQLIVFFSTDLV